MLKEIAIVTIVVSNISQVQSGWEKYFGYTVANQGTVSAELSELWQAGETQDANYVILQPGNDAPVYVRFVEDETAKDYRPMTTYGWNATELLIKDPDSLARNIDGEYFEPLGKPKDLWDAPDAPRAFQAYGPGRELLYLTRNEQAAAALGLDDTMPAVERIFIMVLGGPSMATMRNFYGEQLGLMIGNPMQLELTTFSRINNLGASHRYTLAMVNTAPGYMIELDELPESLRSRTTPAGHLPPGIAIVGFHSDGVSADVEWLSQRQQMDEFPYNGRSAAILRGAAGELIEVIFSPQ